MLCDQVRCDQSWTVENLCMDLSVQCIAFVESVIPVSLRLYMYLLTYEGTCTRFAFHTLIFKLDPFNFK